MQITAEKLSPDAERRALSHGLSQQGKELNEEGSRSASLPVCMDKTGRKQDLESVGC